MMFDALHYMTVMWIIWLLGGNDLYMYCLFMNAFPIACYIIEGMLFIICM